MKKLGAIFIGVALVATAVYSQRAVIVERIMIKGLDARMTADPRSELPDGLHLTLCGAGGPMPAPKASGPCVAVMAGDQFFVVDAGTDGIRNLNRMNYQPAKIDAVLLTHFHSDHIDGLGEMAMGRWVGAGNTRPLPVYGPKGVTTVVDGFNAAYSLDAIYRHDHHGDSVAPVSGTGMIAKPFAQPADGELTTVYQKGGLIIEALAVAHDPIKPAVAYRFTYKGRSLLISGDTVKSENIEQFSQGIDLLVHEGLAPNLLKMMNVAAAKAGNPVLAKISYDVLDYHTSPVEAAEIARDAKVGHLLYYHVVPPIIFPGQETLWLDGAEDVFEDYTVGIDGVTFSMPAGSDEVIKIRDGL
jgi:ribonuclease Z